ncbi:MAG: ATP-dependent sacrificial sulfur transferase LarE [Verrucomicrobiia bacterium]
MLEIKLQKLDEILRDCERLIVAYSGGVDSAFLFYRAYQVLGKNCLGVIADSPSLPRYELEQALAFAKKNQLPVEVIATDEFQNPDYLANPINRCYFCKSALFEKLTQWIKEKKEKKFNAIAYGENKDDLSDFRPGRQAAEEFSVLAPLREAGLTKQEIRLAAQQAGLHVFDKPASPCLSSRIPHGTPVTVETLARIEAGERFLRELGFHIFRLRHYGEEAKIELDEKEFVYFDVPGMKEKIEKGLQQVGYKKVSRMETPYGYAKKLKIS